VLVLHDKSQNVRQTLRLVSIVEADAGAVKCGRRHPVLTSQKPMASCYGRPDLQIVQGTAGSEPVFNMNQASLSSAHQVCPRHNNGRLKNLLQTLISVL